METFSFNQIPSSLDEFKNLPEANLDSPYKTSALALLALMNFEKDTDLAFAMLDFLKGPEPCSTYEKQFITERLKNKQYKINSFFSGATPENGYNPTAPLTITIESNPYSFTEENWALMLVNSSGADSLRQIKLRKKPSTNQWFLNELLCLSDIRLPIEADPWA